MKKLHYIEQCLSTNDEILNFIPFSSHEFQMIGLYTMNQTQGRGQYGNVWKMNPEKNIAMSLIFSEAKIPYSIIINYHTALILRNFIAKLTQEEVFIKWPNDIIVKNKKICGILLEKKKSYLVLGMGVNVLQSDFETLGKAGSLLSVTGKEFSPKSVAESMFDYFCDNLFENVLSSKIVEEFNQYLFRENQVSTFENRLGKRQNGIIRFADEDGYLWIEFENQKMEKFYHKEITLLY